MKNILVLSGNRQQFDFYIKNLLIGKEVDLKDIRGSVNIEFEGTRFIYGDRIEKIAGYRLDDVIVTGTFWQKADAQRVYSFAMSHKK